MLRGGGCAHLHVRTYAQMTKATVHLRRLLDSKCVILSGSEQQLSRIWNECTGSDAILAIFHMLLVF